MLFIDEYTSFTSISKDFLGVLKIEILRDLEWQLFQFSKFLKIKVIMKLNATNVTAKFKNNI